MVKDVTKDEKTHYQCEICKFYYNTEKLAQQCEDFCRKNNSCSLEITKHAVKIYGNCAK